MGKKCPVCGAKVMALYVGPRGARGGGLGPWRVRQHFRDGKRCDGTGAFVGRRAGGGS